MVEMVPSPENECKRLTEFPVDVKSVEMEQEVPTESKATILLVDDERVVREMCSCLLRREGFHVILAAHGVEAIKIIENNAQRLDCVVMDWFMPHMDGTTAIGKIRDMRPEVKVIVASGGDEHEIAGQLDGIHMDGFMQKPFELKSLRGEVHRVLSGI